jgi:hypothetical protein
MNSMVAPARLSKISSDGRLSENVVDQIIVAKLPSGNLKQALASNGSTDAKGYEGATDMIKKSICLRDSPPTLVDRKGSRSVGTGHIFQKWGKRGWS